MVESQVFNKMKRKGAFVPATPLETAINKLDVVRPPIPSKRAHCGVAQELRHTHTCVRSSSEAVLCSDSGDALHLADGRR